MIKDRLSELQEKSVQHGGDAVTVSVVQINTSLQNDEEEEFFEEIDRLKSEVELLTKKIEDLKRKHNAIINPSVDDDERFLRGQVEDCNAEITGLPVVQIMASNESNSSSTTSKGRLKLIRVRPTNELSSALNRRTTTRSLAASNWPWKSTQKRSSTTARA